MWVLEMQSRRGKAYISLYRERGCGYVEGKEMQWKRENQMVKSRKVVC